MDKNSITHLVTGGAGFLGSHLIDELMKSDNENVICLDDFSTGNKNNLSKWLNHPNFELIEHDITKPIKFKVNKIWHLACPASPFYYQNNPIKTAKINFLGTLNMLELAKSEKAKILFTSSSEIYGNPEVHPQKESYRGSVNSTGIRSCYVEGKRISETLCSDYQRKHNVDLRIARVFNTYGPRMKPDDGRVISNFIVQAFKKKPLTIFGDGNQTRSFCYVDDLIKGIILLMNSNFSSPINIGNPEEYSINQVSDIIIKKINPNLKKEYKNMPEDDPKKRNPSITLAKNNLNWEPTVDFSLGINKTINYFRKIL